MLKKNTTATRYVGRRTRSRVGSERFKATLLECVRMGGQVLRGYFGKLVRPRQKDVASSIVCDADLESERRILGLIRVRFPSHNTIAEESGRVWRGSEYTWVIDPLDGTSNFVAGLPWFGVQVALLRGPEPILGAMYLPLEDTLYLAEPGTGAFRNGQKVRVTAEPHLHRVLCAFGFDPAPVRRSRRSIGLLFRVAAAVRNTRTTNSLVDFCYTADGRFGGCINLKTKIWDIAPASLILPEAGGKLTHLDGTRIVFDLSAQGLEKNYVILGGSARLHPKLAALTRRFHTNPLPATRPSKRNGYNVHANISCAKATRDMPMATN
jgi:myo-inositol-1(or 4)-monophosphatase